MLIFRVLQQTMNGQGLSQKKYRDDRHRPRRMAATHNPVPDAAALLPMIAVNSEELNYTEASKESSSSARLSKAWNTADIVRRTVKSVNEPAIYRPA